MVILPIARGNNKNVQKSNIIRKKVKAGMRFLGNKESMVSNIESLLKEKGLLNKPFIFFDAFTGSGLWQTILKKFITPLSMIILHGQSSMQEDVFVELTVTLNI